MKLQKLLSYVRRAVDDYHMIEDGDKIAIGVSGGKDSLCLLLALKHLQRFYPKQFEVEAITVSLGLPGANYEDIQTFCAELGVHYTVVSFPHFLRNGKKKIPAPSVQKCGKVP